MKIKQIQVRTCDNGFMIYSATGQGDFIAGNMQELQTRIKDIFEAPDPVTEVPEGVLKEVLA